MTYNQKRTLAIAISVCLGMLGAASIANADTLGLTPRVLAWLAIFSTGLGILQGFLPSVRAEDQQPDHIANRILELSPSERQELIDTVAAKHEAEIGGPHG